MAAQNEKNAEANAKATAEATAEATAQATAGSTIKEVMEPLRKWLEDGNEVRINASGRIFGAHKLRHSGYVIESWDESAGPNGTPLQPPMGAQTISQLLSIMEQYDATLENWKLHEVSGA